MVLTSTTRTFALSLSEEEAQHLLAIVNFSAQINYGSLGVDKVKIEEFSTGLYSALRSHGVQLL